MDQDFFAGIPLAAGTRIGPYRVESFLARGGMGVVLRGVDENLQRPVALKLIDPKLGRDPEFRERFARECRVLAAIKHPGIVTIYYQGEFEGAPYFAMELVGGFSMERILDEGHPLEVRTAIRWMRECCEALEAARAKDIIHRDLKPANILIDETSEVRIVDFGLAKLEHSEKGLTSASVVMGTPHFLSPEQAAGKILDWRSDLYSLGATFYQLFAGRPVFDAPTVAEIMVAHMTEAPPPLAALAPGVPPMLAELIDRLLSKHPEDRGGADYQETIQMLDTVYRFAPRVAAPRASQATSVLSGDAIAPPAAAVTSAAQVPEVPPLEPGPPLEPAVYGWMVPEGEGPHVALLSAGELAFGCNTALPLYLPDEVGERRRLSRWHGAFEWGKGRYHLAVHPGRGTTRLPYMRLERGPRLETGRYPLEPGQRLDLGAVRLTLGGSHDGGLRVHFEGRDNPVAASHHGAWYWVLFGSRFLAGGAAACGLELPGCGATEERFEVRVDGEQLVLRPLGEGLRVDGEPVQELRPLRHGDRIAGPGFAYRLSLRATPGALWDE